MSGCLARSAAVAASSDSPGASLNMAVNSSADGWCSTARAPRTTGSTARGSATSNGCPTSIPKKSGGMTPMTVQRTPSTGSAVPMTPAAALNRRCQRP